MNINKPSLTPRHGTQRGYRVGTVFKVAEPCKVHTCVKVQCWMCFKETRTFQDEQMGPKIGKVEVNVPDLFLAHATTE